MEKIRVKATFDMSGYLWHKDQILPVRAEGPSSLEEISAYDAQRAVAQGLAEPVVPPKGKKS